MKKSILMISVCLFSLSVFANQTCDQEFKQSKLPLIASYLFDTGDLGAITTGDWTQVLKVGCEFKENMMIRTVSKGEGFSDSQTDCLKYEMTEGQKLEFSNLLALVQNEKLVSTNSVESVKTVSTIVYKSNGKKVILEQLDGSGMFESSRRQGPAAEKLIEMITGMCAFAK